MKENYQTFIKLIHSMLIDGELMDDQTINDFYTAYKESNMKYDMKEWIKFWFAEWTMDKHSFELKKQFKLKLNKFII